MTDQTAQALSHLPAGPRRTRQGQRGFTLVELVTSLLIASILAVGVSRFIGDSVAGYAAASNRHALTSAGRVALARLTVELQGALPNSVRVTPAAANGDQCLEFIPLSHATTYLDPGFDAAGADSFDVVQAPTFPLLPPPAGVYAAIYPINSDELYAPANPGPLAEVNAIAAGALNDGRLTIELQEVHSFPRRSPQDRLYLVQQPVSFCLSAARFYRYEAYGFHAGQCTPSSCLPVSAPRRQLVATDLDNALLTAFELNLPALQRNALVSFNLNFSRQGEAVLLNHDVLVRNVP